MDSGIATGGARGQSATPDREKNAKNQEKEGEIRKKEEKSGRQKWGRFFHYAPPDR